MRIILPLLLVGVFIVGVIGELLPKEVIQQWLGSNSLRSSFLATLIGAISYFATMTEAPFVHKLMQLGMGKVRFGFAANRSRFEFAQLDCYFSCVWISQGGGLCLDHRCLRHACRLDCWEHNLALITAE